MGTPRITLVYFDAGGGHRAAARALQEVITLQRRPWDVRCVNLFEALDPFGRFRRLTGFPPEALYNQRLARGWTWGLARELRWLQRLIRLRHTQLVALLRDHWLATEPDLVVSLIPNFNRALHDSLAFALPGVPFVTVMTDMADLPPHFWIERGLDQHIVCGTEHAVEQARMAGFPLERIHLTSGMILRPSFHAAEPVDRSAARAALGLPQDEPVGVVMFGGEGSMQMLDVAKALRERPLILICGRHQVVARRLRELRPAAPHAVLGFVEDMRSTMGCGDYFIGKPGPASITEAIHVGLPVITYDNRRTMPQERYNTRWLRERGLGVVLKDFADLPRACDQLVGQLPDFRRRVAAVDNRAIFELPEILAALMREPAAPRVALPLHDLAVPG